MKYQECKTLYEDRHVYDETGILPPVNWLEVFRQNLNAKRLFDYSIPATVKKRTVSLICSNDDWGIILQRHFVCLTVQIRSGLETTVKAEMKRKRVISTSLFTSDH